MKARKKPARHRVALKKVAQTTPDRTQIRQQVQLIDLIRDAQAAMAKRGIVLEVVPMPATRHDTSILVHSIQRAQHELSRLAESLCEGEDDIPLGELARAIGALVTAEREAKGIGGTLETDDDDATESAVAS